MTDKQEQAWMEGNKAAYASILNECIRHLSPERNAESWRLEREAAIASLRRLCEEFGYTDWDDNLHLADIIDKYLAPGIEEESEPS